MAEDEYEILDEDGRRVAIIRKLARSHAPADPARKTQVMIAGVMLIGLLLWGLWATFARHLS